MEILGRIELRLRPSKVLGGSSSLNSIGMPVHEGTQDIEDFLPSTGVVTETLASEATEKSLEENSRDAKEHRLGKSSFSRSPPVEVEEGRDRASEDELPAGSPW